ncbi:unnamed protein product [Pleuronectes platessa]|uniref:Uncharacterized protein n=1 Tax=Pleuronectes platessa TaxID=8262 RepID=A0A9N7Z6V1_PLEPL|nr:unnamed protein product [Pleuronectes platessa]
MAQYGLTEEEEKITGFQVPPPGHEHGERVLGPRLSADLCSSGRREQCMREPLRLLTKCQVTFVHFLSTYPKHDLYLANCNPNPAPYGRLWLRGRVVILQPEDSFYALVFFQLYDPVHRL